MKKHVPFLVSLLGIMSLLAWTATVRAQIVTVTSDGGAGSLRDEITNASVGDTIWFDASLEGATVNTNGVITIANDVVIIGFPEGEPVTIDAGYSGRMFSISNTASVVFHGVNFTKGIVSTGGAFLNSGTLELNYCRLFNNLSEILNLNQGGGAIFNNTAATLTLNHCEFYDNVANSPGQTGDAAGGAIYHRGTSLSVNYCSFYDNLATTQEHAGLGGAIFSKTILNIKSSTFSGNSAHGSSASHGGAIHSGTNATLNIQNSTISNNGSTGSQRAGGNIWHNGDLVLQNSIVANGSASTGSDIYTDPAAGVATSLGNNILESNSNSNMTYLSSDMAVDPQLDTLAYNGHAFTKTRALMCNSPAIDAGNSTNAPSSDQAGKTRVVGSSIDIGAYELQAAPTIVQDGLTLSIPEQGVFQWYNGSTAISGATDSSYTVTSNGTYHVEFLDVSGCPLSSNAVSVITVGVNENLKENAMKLFPNPATNVTTVSLLDLRDIELLDVSGRLIKSLAVITSTQSDIDISELPAGVYFISATNREGVKFSQRLMKH